MFSSSSWIFNSGKILHSTELGFLSAPATEQVCLGPGLAVTHGKTILLIPFS